MAGPKPIEQASTHCQRTKPKTGSKNLKPLFLRWFFLERKSFLYSKTLEPGSLILRNNRKKKLRVSSISKINKTRSRGTSGSYALSYVEGYHFS
jgi:hypothetical protein